MKAREAASALLFFGALSGRPELEQVGRTAISELEGLGYQTPSSKSLVQVYELPRHKQATGFAAHAGTWRPGVIHVRDDPASAFDESTYLRHELMHEASHRTCRGSLPRWAEEAFALTFSGELATQDPTPPSSDDLTSLRAAAEVDAPLGPKAIRGLRHWIATRGWPKKPCTVPPDALRTLAPSTDRRLSWRLTHLLSGRTLATSGDQTAEAPLGSLLKIPFVAALDASALASTDVARLLAESDGDALLKLKTSVSRSRYASFYPDGKLPASMPWPPDATWLGLRAEGGAFGASMSLTAATSLLRAAMLTDFPRFAPEAEAAHSSTATLAHATNKARAAVFALGAVVKTGSVSTANGAPLVGHAVFVWPADAPVYLAVFRLGGGQGFQTVDAARSLLDEWRGTLPVQRARASVQLMSKLPRHAWNAFFPCGRLTARVAMSHGEPPVTANFDRCGELILQTTAARAKSERRVAGLVVEDGPRGAVLFTDPDSYADGVVDAEADKLPRNARAALRAVVAWNATSAKRHTGLARVCDTTHCMLFLGNSRSSSSAPVVTTDVWRTIARLASSQPDPTWLSYSNGGDLPWRKRLDPEGLRGLVRKLVEGPAEVLSLQRSRHRTGDLTVRLMTPGGEATIPCEVFRNALHLYSCPESLNFDPKDGSWTAQGKGEGHGQGLELLTAERLALAGSTPAAIVEAAYRAGL